MINKDKALEWWNSQGSNSKCDVYRVGCVDFGNDSFIDVFWRYKGECGRDRVRKNSRGYNRELLEV